MGRSFASNIGIIGRMGGYRYDLSSLVAIVIWVAAATGTTLGQQPQPQTPGAPAPTTASIVGRLFDATTG